MSAARNLRGPWRYRSAVTGKYVTEAYAKRYPRLTVREAAQQYMDLTNWLKPRR